MDQPDAGGVSPNQHGRSRHEGCVNARRNDDAVILGGGGFDHALEFGKIQFRITKCVGQIEDRVACLLTVDTVQGQFFIFGQLVETHVAGLPNRSKLGRVAEHD